MTYSEFRANKDLTDWVAGLLEQKKFRLLIEAMDTEHPRFFREARFPFSESATSYSLGTVHGWDVFLERLRDAAKYTPALIDQPAATFEQA